jgi:GT2 family glycosyltransferase
MLSKIKAVVKRVPGVGPFLQRMNRRRVESQMRARDKAIYEPWVLRQIVDRVDRYPAPTVNPPVFDILTVTYETDPGVLRDTARTVFDQDYPHWRWVILDNGSKNPATLEVLEELARDPRVRLKKSTENLRITRGHAAALPLCEGEYVVLLDHDDLLSLDALRVVAWHIDAHDRPGYLYSDEDKCSFEGDRWQPSMKPTVSPNLLLETMYCCHLSVARRDVLTKCGAFTDPRVEGTQDWDMALRMFESGARVAHVPEILYTWRSTPQSTAEHGVSAKPYVIASQRHCLQSALERRGLSDRFDVRTNPLFPLPDGHWKISRRPTGAAPAVQIVVAAVESVERVAEQVSAVLQETDYPNYRLTVVSVAGDRTVDQLAGELRGRLGALPRQVTFADGRDCGVNFGRLLNRQLEFGDDTPLIGWLPPGACPLARDWIWEALGCLELNDSAALVGGRMVDGIDRTIGGAGVFGLNGAVEALYLNSSRGEQGYAGLNLCRRNVTCVLRAPWLARREALRRIEGCDPRFPRAFFDADLCARLVEAGYDIVFTPHWVARGAVPPIWGEYIAQEVHALYETHGALLKNDPFYGSRFSLIATDSYRIVPPAERAGMLNCRLAHQRASNNAADARHADAPSDHYETACPAPRKQAA